MLKIILKPILKFLNLITRFFGFEIIDTYDLAKKYDAKIFTNESYSDFKEYINKIDNPRHFNKELFKDLVNYDLTLFCSNINFKMSSKDFIYLKTLKTSLYDMVKRVNKISKAFYSPPLFNMRRIGENTDNILIVTLCMDMPILYSDELNTLIKSYNYYDPNANYEKINRIEQKTELANFISSMTKIEYPSSFKSEVDINHVKAIKGNNYITSFIKLYEECFNHLIDIGAASLIYNVKMEKSVIDENLTNLKILNTEDHKDNYITLKNDIIGIKSNNADCYKKCFYVDNVTKRILDLNTSYDFDLSAENKMLNIDTLYEKINNTFYDKEKKSNPKPTLFNLDKMDNFYYPMLFRIFDEDLIPRGMTKEIFDQISDDNVGSISNGDLLYSDLWNFIPQLHTQNIDSPNFMVSQFNDLRYFDFDHPIYNIIIKAINATCKGSSTPDKYYIPKDFFVLTTNYLKRFDEKSFSGLNKGYVICLINSDYLEITDPKIIDVLKKL